MKSFVEVIKNYLNTVKEMERGSLTSLMCDSETLSGTKSVHQQVLR